MEYSYNVKIIFSNPTLQYYFSKIVLAEFGRCVDNHCSLVSGCHFLLEKVSNYIQSIMTQFLFVTHFYDTYIHSISIYH